MLNDLPPLDPSPLRAKLRETARADETAVVEALLEAVRIESGQRERTGCGPRRRGRAESRPSCMPTVWARMKG
jgi:hypothetical protein